MYLDSPVDSCQGDILWRWLPLIYLVYVVPMLLFMFINYPLFVSPDEPNHFLRAEQITHGGVFGFKISQTASGGYVDVAAITVSKQYMDQNSPFDWRNHVFFSCLTAELANRNQGLGWKNQLVFASFHNTSNYPPIGYMPVAIGIMIGKTYGLSVIKTAYFSRLINGITSIALSTVALVLCRRGRYTMFTILLFPMTISLFSSLSQDPLLISSGALFAGLLSRVLLRIPNQGAAWWETIGLALCVLVLGTSRFSYAALAICLLLPEILPIRQNQQRNLLWRLMIFAGISLATLAWTQFVFSTSYIYPSGNYGINKKIEYITGHPYEIFNIINQTFL